MVLETLVTALNTDADIAALIGSNKVYCTPCTDLGECITYNFIPSSDDKIIRKDRLELNVITNTFAKGVQLSEQIKNVLLTFADTAYNHEILKIELNGGGQLFDDERQKHHAILYFYVQSKKL